MSDIKNKKIVAIIPARGGSREIPGKNIIDFCGKPLLGWSIEQARASKYIEDVYVSSDDQKILELAVDFKAKAITRPKELALDNSGAEETLEHALGQIGEPVDIVVFLQATSPLRGEQDIDEAIELFISQEADSLFSAAVLGDFCVWEVTGGEFKSLTFDYKNRGMRQDREPYYLENGSIYMFKPEVLKKYNNRLGGKIVFYPMPLWKSYEIDKFDDLEICENYMRSKILTEKNHSFCFDDLKLIVYDFDGVLTDNRVVLSQEGTESVVLNRSDGMAISLIKKIPISQIILSSETNEVVEIRAAKLGLPVIKGAQDKKSILTEYCAKNNIELKNTAYLGNDLNDLEAMKICGLSIVPQDACKEVKAVAGIILKASGGKGVVRELLSYLNQEPKARQTR